MMDFRDDNHDTPMSLLNRAKDVVLMIQHYTEDNDIVLCRRFRRLHLYNLYNKHNRLVELDRDIHHFEDSVMSGKNGSTSEKAFDEATKFQSLLEKIDSA